MNRQGGSFDYAVFESRWGWMGAAGSVGGLVALVLPQRTAIDVIAVLGVTATNGRQNNQRFRKLFRKIDDYLAGQPVALEEVLDLSAATPFQRQVWTQTRQIPYGQSRTYSWVAAGVGKPSSCRAVGQALGRNPLPIIIPCHRVLAANGSLGGFSGGLETKKRLLELEGISTD